MGWKGAAVWRWSGEQPRGDTPRPRSGRGGQEEIPLVQGKRNPSKMVGVARGLQGADTLKPQSQKTSQSDHTDHSLV